MKKLKQGKPIAGAAPMAPSAAPATGGPAGIPLFLRSKAEASLGRPLDNVRLHTDSEAAESARSIGARAYTTGRDVVFAPGQYRPETPAGQRLLAHELAHVVQQSGGETTLGRGTANDPHEQSARRAAGNVMAGTPAAVAPTSGAPAVQCENEEHVAPDPKAARAAGSGTVDSFTTGSADLNEAQRAHIATIAASIVSLRADFPSSSVAVTGHTDAVGAEAFNDVLGQMRAESVKQELIAQGVPAEAVSASSAGSRQLKVRTKSAEARNRRAEISFEPDSRPQKKADDPKPDDPKADPQAPPQPAPQAQPAPQPAPLPQDAPKAPIPPPLLPLSHAQELGRKIFAPIPPDPRNTPKGPGKPLLSSIDKAMDSVLERIGVPAPLRPLVKSGAKSAATKAILAPLDAAMDQAKLNDNDKTAVRTAFKAAVDIALP